VTQEPQSEFVSQSSVPQTELPPAPLIYGAYAFVWAVFVIYVFFLWRRIGRVERELADVNQKLKTRG
jgi:CcmD family protein